MAPESGDKPIVVVEQGGTAGSRFRRQGQNDRQHDQDRGIFLTADRSPVEKRLKNNGILIITSYTRERET